MENQQVNPKIDFAPTKRIAAEARTSAISTAAVYYLDPHPDLLRGLAFPCGFAQGSS
jgi:hypothetical protein